MLMKVYCRTSMEFQCHELANGSENSNLSEDGLRWKVKCHSILTIHL